MLSPFRSALKLLTKSERRRAFALLALSAIAAIVQTAAIFSVLPFIVLLADPSLIETNVFVRRAYTVLAVDSYRDFLIALGGFAVAALAVGNLFLALEQWLTDRFLAHSEHRLARDLLRTMLDRPYEYFAGHRTGQLGNIVLEQVERAIGGVLGTFVAIASNVALAGLIVLTLLVIDPLTTVITLAALVFLYLAVFLLLRRRIEQHGEALTRLSGETSSAVKEILDGVKEIQTSRKATFFAKRFEDSALPLTRLSVKASVLSFLPNFLLETAVFTGLVVVALYFVVATADTGRSLSYIALYGIATYRLIPSLKQVFEGFAAIQHNVSALQLVSDHMDGSPPPVRKQSLPPPAREIRFDSVSYRYPDADGSQLQNVDLIIPVGSSVCLFGESGAGKTTLLNVLVGLLEPHSGQLMCDGEAISASTVDSWRTHLGYCPQQVFLYDDSIAANIAFGVPATLIDAARVRDVGTLARLHDGREAKGIRNFESIIGEGGASLSGGQRQRIGIARALYRDPAIVILDEALSGLDSPNQSAILDNLFALPEKTLVFSSHSEAIARRCKQIAVVDGGAIVAQGSYDELRANCPQFVELLSKLTGGGAPRP